MPSCSARGQGTGGRKPRVSGPAPRLAALCPSVEELISGGMVKSHVDALRQRLGVPAYDRSLAALAEAHRAELLFVTPLSWVHIAALEALYGVVAPDVGMTVAELHTQIAAQVVGKAVTTLWRVLLRLATDELLVARGPTIFAKTYKQGRLEVARSAVGSCDLRIVAWPSMSEFALRGFRVGIESTLRASARRDPHGTSHRTAEGALLRFVWSGGR